MSQIQTTREERAEHVHVNVGNLKVDHVDAAELYVEVKAPLSSTGFTGHDVTGGTQTDHMLDGFARSQQVCRRYSSEQLDDRRVGHHGFRRCKQTDLWDELVLLRVAGYLDTT